MNIFIATPTRGGTVHLGYVNTLVRLIEYLNSEAIPWSHNSYDGAEIVDARNYLANQFLREREPSHILFIDSDMDVQTSAIKAVITRGEDFVGTVAPQKSLDFNKYWEMAQSGENQVAALSASLNFVVRHDAGQLEVNQGFCKLRGVGFGFVLISRKVFDKMVSHQIVNAIPAPAQKMTGGTGPYYDFFSRTPAKSGAMLSEDYSFCDRALSLEGMSIWGWIGAGVGHSGVFCYEGSYLEQLRAKARE